MATKKYRINRLFYMNGFEKVYYAKMCYPLCYQCEEVEGKENSPFLVPAEYLGEFFNFEELLEANGFVNLPYDGKVTLEEYHEWMRVFQNIKIECEKGTFAEYQIMIKKVILYYYCQIQNSNRYATREQISDFMGILNEYLLYQLMKKEEKDRRYLFLVDDPYLQECLELSNLKISPSFHPQILLVNKTYHFLNDYPRLGGNDRYQYLLQKKLGERKN